MAFDPPPLDDVSLLLAEWVAPMDQPMLRHAGLAISGGKILAVAPARQLRSSFPDAASEDLGQAILLPGLVNAHVHLELSALTPGAEPDSFVSWLKRLVPRTPLAPESVRRFVERGIELGVAQCVGFGVTSVGDISRQCAITRPLLQNGPLRVVSYGEVQAMAQRRGLLDERLEIAADRSCESERLTVGVSPHAPYSVEAFGYRRCLAKAEKEGMSIATHLAETPGEGPFLAQHAGEFRELWGYLEAWDEEVPRFAGGPIRFAREIGLLDYPSLLAHVNYCDDHELSILAAGRASVVVCPRTHAWFGHPAHRWREMLQAGINVAVGTDSCASSPDLNLADDLRLLRATAPDVLASELWEMATLRAARAIGLERRVGSLSPGKAADIVAWPASGADPLEALLQSPANPSAVWIGGAKS